METLRGGREQVGPVVPDLVDAVTEAHEALAVFELLAQVGLGPVCLLDLEDHIERRTERPPCSGPLSAPTAPTTAETMSDRVETITLAAKVEAFMP